MPVNEAAHFCHVIGGRMAAVRSREEQDKMISQFWEKGDNCKSERWDEIEKSFVFGPVCNHSRFFPQKADGLLERLVGRGGGGPLHPDADAGREDSRGKEGPGGRRFRPVVSGQQQIRLSGVVGWFVGSSDRKLIVFFVQLYRLLNWLVEGFQLFCVGHPPNFLLLAYLSFSNIEDTKNNDS